MNQNTLSAQVFLNVNTFEDQNDGGEVDGLSLRDAIIIANSDLRKKYTINLPDGTYNLTLTDDGSLDINSNVNIIGASAGNTLITAGFLGDRIFTVARNGSLNLANITLQDANVGTENGIIDDEGNTGNIPVDGGAISIQPSGKATLENVIIAQNRTNGKGGGIANNGVLEISDSVLLVNFSVGNGGAIYNGDGGIVSINRSTIAFNSTSNTLDQNALLGGGGIFNDSGGNLTIVNSTISGNTSLIGGGIWTQGDQAIIVNSTIANNSGSRGAGIFSGNPQNANALINTTLRNNIIAENINSADIQGIFNNLSSYNLIGASERGSLVNDFNNNSVGTIESPINPLIGDLPNQFTTTDQASALLVHPLEEGSPAINAGNNANSQIRDLFNNYGNEDQRGAPRISDGIVDIGSYEVIQNSGINTNNFSSQLNTPIYRFRNNTVSGTYLFVGESEAQNIRANNRNFIEEGEAFRVGITPDDDLIPIYRFQNQEKAGTYLYVGEEERQSILQNYNNFKEEGLAFYVYGADANKGQDIYRLQNLNQPGTYLFVGEAEKNNIINNFSNFRSEGVAFEVA
ncbi:alkaline phosphatase [Geminocystis sp. NIES-3708]|uniref:choice-of-anchor Q domain-containing protein n=1 Tax=Geminocystis sp. NIES-3708 TaxID=1615909 RepID=UPI0005FC7ADE|nr:choice-of-anchor Q domain-containing protein [Geminocystis sp. NIES-3708]BAQ61687.1 alkaline phosphatase [Geminocystis sp. NIES-3708]